MTLTSINFFVFLVIITILYYGLLKKWQCQLLVMASWGFCWLAGGIYAILFLIFITLMTYWGAIKIQQSVNGKKTWLIFVIILCLGTWGILKFLLFISDTLRLPLLSNKKFTCFMPLGISFYSLQMIGYVTDVYRGLHTAQRNFWNYALFADFFPQLITGPINRYSDLSANLFLEKRFDFVKICFGIQRIFWGLFKKLVISERLTIIVNTVYNDPSTFSGFYIIFAAICFSFQLYTDFSGAIDIVLGTSEILGITLTENFQTPFFARSIQEFWRRWHITLGTWCKDYIMFPLLKSDMFYRFGELSKKKFGKKIAKNLTAYAGMFVLWCFAGLWHGITLNYLIGAGLLQWFYIVSGQTLQPYYVHIIRKLNINEKSAAWNLLQRIRTFCLITFGFIFFRSSNFSQALTIIKLIFRKNTQLFIGDTLSLGLDRGDLLVVIVSLGVVGWISMLKQKGNVREKISNLKLPVRWFLYYALIFSVLILGYYGPEYGVGEFLYQNF